MTAPTIERRTEPKGVGPSAPRRTFWAPVLGAVTVGVGIVLLVAAVAIALGPTDAPDSGTDFVVTAPAEEVADVAGSGAQTQYETFDVPAETTAAPQPESVLSDSVTSPRFSTVPVYSGLLGDATAKAPAATPVGLSIPSLGVNAHVRDVGYDPGRDVMEVPGDADTVGWYRYGAVPGQQGSAVLAAHVSWYGQRGTFYTLGELEPGSRIEVAFSDGTAATFEAVARETYPKTVLPTDRLFAKDVPAVLHLITCGGDYDASVGSYRDNVVVSAVLVDTSNRPIE